MVGAGIKLVIRNLFTIICSLAVLSVNANEARELYVVGKAYRPGTDQLLYIEQHYGNMQKGTVEEVIYLDSEQRHIAIKKLTMASGLYTPEFVQIDHRNGQLIAIKDVGEKSIEVVYRASLDTDHFRKSIVKSPSLIVDSGFNKFVLDNWDYLRSGGKLDIDFVVPSRLSSIEMSVTAIACKSLIIRCFSVSPQNIILKLFVGTVELEYSADTQRLLKFQGLGNINDSYGKAQRVEIRYEYPVHSSGRQKFLI
jgi:hypothetical protein